MRTLIYALFDEDHQIRWIGKSFNIRKRFRDHCRIFSWVTGYIELEWVEDGWQATERRWIAFGKSAGWPLQNKSDGGEGSNGFKMLPESIDKMRRALTGSATLETRQKLSRSHKGRKFSEEHRQKISRWRSGPGNPARLESVRAKISAALKGRKRTEEFKRKISDSLKGIPKSAKMKAHLAKCRTERWAKYRQQKEQERIKQCLM